MAFGLKKETIDDVITVLAAVLIFNTLPQFQVVGGYFQQYPIIIFSIAIMLIVFRDKIAEKIGEK